MALASRISCVCSACRAVAISVASVFWALSPAWADAVTYDYVLDITRIKGALEASPFSLSDDVQIFGRFSMDISSKDKAAENPAFGNYDVSILDSVFAFSWDSGSYESGAASGSKFSSKLVNETQGAAGDLGKSAAQDLFEFKDKSSHETLGAFEFTSLKITLEDNADAAAFSDDGLPDLLDLDDFDNATFSLRFKDKNRKITYTGFVSSLEAFAASGGNLDVDAAVPLPPSLFGLLGGFGLLWLRHSGRKGSGRCNAAPAGGLSLRRRWRRVLMSRTVHP